jgi:hypothetical protein
MRMSFLKVFFACAGWATFIESAEALEPCGDLAGYASRARKKTTLMTSS